MLVPRQEITGADRQWAERYEPGDVVRYSRGSKALGIDPGDYARVERVDAKRNQVTVRRDDERSVTSRSTPPTRRDALSRDRACIRDRRSRANDRTRSRTVRT